MTTALRLNLTVPDVRAGHLTPGDLLGVHLSDVLLASGVLESVPRSGPEGLVYPLTIPDGGEIAIPFPVPLLGKTELFIGNDTGQLRLVVPSIAFVVSAVQKSLVRWTVKGPMALGHGTAFWLTLKSGQRASWNLGGFGCLAVEVP